MNTATNFPEMRFCQHIACGTTLSGRVFTKSRLELTDNMQSAIVKMAEGNPGAAIALCELATRSTDNPLGGLGMMLLLDSFGIYGTDIYVLFSDISGKDVNLMCAYLIAAKEGLLPTSILKDACSRQDRTGKSLLQFYNIATV
jgi:hypothetical protein